MLIIRNGRAAGGRLLALVITVVLTLVNFEAVAAAASQRDGVVRSQVVRYEGAVLDNPVAAQALYSRLRMAAKRVCRRASDQTSNGDRAAACAEAAVAEAVVRVNHAAITAIHRARMDREEAQFNAWLMAPTPCAQCG